MGDVRICNSRSSGATAFSAAGTTSTPFLPNDSSSQTEAVNLAEAVSSENISKLVRKAAASQRVSESGYPRVLMFFRHVGLFISKPATL